KKRGLDLVACPSCGRAEVDVLGLTKRVNEALEKSGLKAPIRVAVMGCVVNGPGEAREADLGIAAGTGYGQLVVEGGVQERRLPVSSGWAAPTWPARSTSRAISIRSSTSAPRGTV